MVFHGSQHWCLGARWRQDLGRVRLSLDDDALLRRRLLVDGHRRRRLPSLRRTTIPTPDVRKQNRAFYEFMVLLVKGYSTGMSIEVASLGVQVHGGMCFIEESGAAQYLRDARILTRGVRAAGGLLGRRHQGEPECGARRFGSSPDACGQCGGRLANGADVDLGGIRSPRDIVGHAKGRKPA